jgi:branched-chain amino acid aminotransferase
LIKLDEGWIPAVKGFSAYLRPTFIATEETLGVRYPTKAKLFCAICPVGPYFPGALKAIKVYCNT